ncbi:copper resistance protein B [Tsuneonella sp. YG55]|uniref:Copper resistance protein B n=1 Tax=Tsuneonella litorea TaxID=2976475 RepID=A0A9X2W2W1_9SPHN|nr:copper resistance protein B [Tsuneonella litorea]MCT2559603.1 copper resistance protein B [Tsuneonella litorea]
MRALLLATAALVAAPVAAQDHSAHAGHSASTQDPVAGNEAESHAHGASANQPAAEHAVVDHSAMDHSTMDHSKMDQPATDRSAMDHSTMDHSAMDHSEMDHGAVPVPSSGPPPRALEGPRHAADVIFGAAAMAPSREQLALENGGFRGGSFMFDRLETRVGQGEDLYLWDAQGWYGGDIDKLWIKSEGEGAFGGAVESAEVQALWSHAIDPWFDLQAGVRYDLEPRSRAHAVIGVQGLAPYMFEVDAAAFLSDRGDLTARIEAEYDQRITQRLILQPRAEIVLAAQDVRPAGVGAGLSSIEAGLRLRYEIAREFAPYIGVDYEAKLGRTADFARADGERPDRVFFLLGVRAWF